MYHPPIINVELDTSNFLVLVCFWLFFLTSLFIFISLLLTAFLLFCSPYLRLDHFDGLIPFDFKTGPTDSNSKYLGESSVMQSLFVKHTKIFLPSSCIFYVFFCVGPSSEPCVLGAHLLLQRSFVRCGSPETGVGLRPHHHACARSNHQPRWAEAWQTLKTVPRFQVFFLPCSDAGVPHGLAVVAGFR